MSTINTHHVDRQRHCSCSDRWRPRLPTAPSHGPTTLPSYLENRSRARCTGVCMKVRHLDLKTESERDVQVFVWTQKVRHLDLKTESERDVQVFVWTQKVRHLDLKTESERDVQVFVWTQKVRHLDLKTESERDVQVFVWRSDILTLKQNQSEMYRCLYEVNYNKSPRVRENLQIKYMYSWKLFHYNWLIQ